MYRVALVFLFLLGSAVGAEILHPASAYREPGRSYLEYKAKAILGEAVAGGKTPLNTARTDLGNLPKATEWESTTVMKERFERFRDFRFMSLPSKPNFPRRSSWMYPDDGCFVRAALAVRNLVQFSAEAPKKVFAFGDLTVKTSNSPSGEVSWWYHVAPLVEIAGQKYVLDPALAPKTPLKLEEWLALMSATPGDIEVSVCESGAYTPGDDCKKVTDGEETRAEHEQVYYLDLEWERLVDLNRNPDEELGDNPPWLKVSAYFW